MFFTPGNFPVFKKFEDNAFSGVKTMFTENKDGLRSKDFCFGSWRNKSVATITRLVRFHRLTSKSYKEATSQDLVLFKKDRKLSVSDISQGKLGDCWVLACIGVIAEHDERILRNLFSHTPRIEDGKFVIKLYNPARKKWETVITDDRVPCFAYDEFGVERNTPIFSRPVNDEIWVLLLEKAFAKFHGGYAFLKGGYARHAFQCLTGKPVIGFVRFST